MRWVEENSDQLSHKSVENNTLKTQEKMVNQAI